MKVGREFSVGGQALTGGDEASDASRLVHPQFWQSDHAASNRSGQCTDKSKFFYYEFFLDSAQRDETLQKPPLTQVL